MGSFCLHCPICYDVTVLAVVFVMAAAGQLGAAGRYEPLALAEMQSGNNFHRFELHAEKKTRMPHTSCFITARLRRVPIDLNFLGL